MNRFMTPMSGTKHLPVNFIFLILRRYHNGQRKYHGVCGVAVRPEVGRIGYEYLVDDIIKCRHQQ